MRSGGRVEGVELHPEPLAPWGSWVSKLLGLEDLNLVGVPRFASVIDDGSWGSPSCKDVVEVDSLRTARMARGTMEPGAQDQGSSLKTV